MKYDALAYRGSPLVWLFLLAAAAQSSGQELTYDNGHIYYVEGRVHLQRALEPEPESGDINLPVLPGDRIWTESASRAEVRFSDGTVLRLDAGTKVDFIDLGSQQLLHVWSGSVIVVKTNTAALRIDSPAGSVDATTAGSYRIDVAGGETITLSVYEGSAELSSDRGSVVLHRGQRSVLGMGQAPDSLWPFGGAEYDDFDAWSAGRDQITTRPRDTLIRSLPHEIQPYASELTTQGQWRTHSEYGSVWYPSVSIGWTPYRDGRWSYTPYGYTWVSNERWGWAPYHYGRWGYESYGWYWIPGRHWGPAWVSFAVGPTWIGWSPLGYHGRPVYGFHSVVGRHRYNRNKSVQRYRGGKAVPRHLYEHGAGWHFAGRKHFARGRAASARLRAVDVERGAARARLLNTGAVLNRDFTPRAIGARAVSQDVVSRGRRARRSSASIGRRARTALRSRAVEGYASARGRRPPSRSERSTAVKRTRSSSRPPAARSNPETSGTRARGRSGGRTLRSVPERTTRGPRQRNGNVSRRDLPSNGRGVETRGAARTTGRARPRRGGQEVFDGSGRTERVQPRPTRSRTTNTRGRPTTSRRPQSTAPPRSSRTGVRSGNRAPNRPAATRGSRSTAQRQRAGNRGVGGNPGRGRASRARTRKRQ